MFQQFGHVQEKAQTNFMYKVYGWMCAALAVTAVTAWYVAASTTFFNAIIAHPFMLLGIFIAQLSLVIILSGMIHKMNYPTAVVLFMVYAISLGVTMSLVFRAYTLPSLASTFVVTSGMFGGMALYGYFTKSDLTRVRNIGIMVLWGMILSMLVNFYFQSMWFDYIISMVGVVIFSLLTAADTQKIKELQERLPAEGDIKNKIAILGALTLYLDFINLFLFLLRFTGSRRSQ
jgi:FtsH-binding integral membrane protein